MSTARNYLAREIYRSTLVVLFALIGLFSFFTLVDQLNSISESFPLTALLYLELLALPTRTYELLPIGLLVGAVLALASLAQRNELVILRVSGVSSGQLLRMLWAISIPIIALAMLLSEVLTPAAEIRYSEANLMLRGKVEGGRMVSGYWFKEPRENGGFRIINIGQLLSNGDLGSLFIYDFEPEQVLTSVTRSDSGKLQSGKLIMEHAVRNKLPANAFEALSQATAPSEPLMQLENLDNYQINTSLTTQRLVAKILVPERMSIHALWDYTNYMRSNNLNTDRQMVALWRKLAYPFTLVVMMSIAAPIAFIQTRRGGVAAKIFIGILVGTLFFMVNQLTLNIGMLYDWNPIVTALLPSVVTFACAVLIILNMERRVGPKTLSPPRKDQGKAIKGGQTS